MTGKAGSGVRVRGTCKAGHVTETSSTPGRTTWHGPCAHDGCELKVYARRVPGDVPATEPTAETPPPNDPHTVIEVPAYRDDAKPSFDADDRPGPPVPAGDGAAPDVPPASQDATAAAGAGTGGAGGGGAVDVAEQPRGLRGRLQARRAGRGSRQADEDEDHFFPTVGF